MSLVIPYIINMYRFGVLDQLGQLIILIYHICIFGVRDLLEINVVQSKIFVQLEISAKLSIVIVDNFKQVLYYQSYCLQQ